MVRVATQTIERLYKLHETGALSSDDPRWEDVSNQLRQFAESIVRQRCNGLYGSVVYDRVQDVHLALLEKFINLKFSNAKSFNTLLGTSAKNDLIAAFRRSKSPNTVCFDGAESVWAHEAEPEVMHTDAFASVRAHLGSFRFPEHPHIREAVLSFLLSTGKYPGSSFLHNFAVHRSVRVAVYNAAIVDINKAMIRFVDET